MSKRLFDLIASAAGLAVLLPVLIVVAILVRLFLGTPIIFRQRRPGLGGRPFTMYKFRTMTNARDSRGNLLPDSDRLTRLGRILRATSLDELPELVNVVKGEMSLVGPRPLLMEYMDRYTPRQRRRHEVRPGITGMAQVNGRQNLPFSRRLELDVWYVQNQSFWLDLGILFRTMANVFAARGVVSGQDVTDVDDLGLATGTVAPGASSDRPAINHSKTR